MSPGASAAADPISQNARPVLIAFRHAPVALAGVCYGRLDVAAELPAADVADRIERDLGALRPGVVWSSALSRCAAVAAELSARLGVRHAVDDRLLEIAYGRWEGRAWTTIEREEPAAYAAWTRDWERAGPPGGEAAVDVEQRVRSWWSALSPAHPHLLVAHAGALRALRVVTGGLSWIDAMRAPAPHVRPERFPLPPSEPGYGGGGEG